jgi:predicted aspartyl protease
MRPIPSLITFATLLLAVLPAAADTFQTRVAMIEKSAATFYVPAEISGFGATELMVDTGSGYVVINEVTLEVLERNGQARYVKPLRGVLANGSELTVPVYAVDAIAIGDNCWLHDVEVAVFPGNSRQILGLSALRRTAPFVFSVEPPELQLSRCAPPLAANTLAPAPGVQVD